MIRTWPELDPNCRVIKTPDVTNRDCWPKAPSKYVFIFEAINLAGSALFAGVWTGKELAAVIWDESPRHERVQAHLPMARGAGAGGSYSSQSMQHNPVARPKDFHVQDWRAEQRQPLWEENARALERLEQAVEWLAQRCREGELTSHYRRRTGGSNLVRMRDADWNLENPLFHFVIYGGTRRRSGAAKPSSLIDSYLFFEKAELLAAIEQEPAAQLVVREWDLSRLSPYLQLAIRVALARKYFARANCETQAIREAEVEGAWPDLISDIEAVPSMVTAIARVINFPDADAIKKGRLGGQRRKTGITRKA